MYDVGVRKMIIRENTVNYSFTLISFNLSDPPS